jgi:pimeloyl-[acyl-carrier protein] methyl ester esterase
MDGTGEMFAPFVTALADAYAIKIISYPVGGALGYKELADFARAALPQDAPYVLLGESFSGPISIMLAATAKENLQGLILCATFAGNPQPKLVFSQNCLRFLPVKFAPPFVANQLLMGSFSTPALRTALAHSLAQVSADALRARMLAVLGVDVRVQLGQIRVPVLYLRAARDRLVPKSASDQVLAVCGYAEEVVFDAPHFLLQTKPTAAADCVNAFCSRLAPLC